MGFIYLIAGVFVVWLIVRTMGSRPRVEPRRRQRDEGPAEIFRIESPPRASSQPSPDPDHLDKDNWEGSFWEVGEPMPVQASLRIRYTDGNDRKTERSVAVRSFGSMGPYHLIMGHCSLRDATRTFRSDRIGSCVDEETGEVIKDVAAYLLAKFEQSPEKTARQLQADEYDTLRVLLYVGKADGQFRGPEKQAVVAACVEITGDSRLTVKMLDDMLAGMDVPTLQAFKMAVGRLAKRERTVVDLVMRTAEAIVATQRTVHPSEQEALDYMRRKFSPAGGSD